VVFDKQWFKQNQWWLLPYVSHNRDNLFIETNKPLIEIAPDHVSWLEEPELVTTEFHVHHVYGRRLYQRLSPLWNLMHRIDMSTLGRAANLNFGFDTLTKYPDAHPETTTVDGCVWHAVAENTFATFVGGAGTNVTDNSSVDSSVFLWSGATSPKFQRLQRGIFLFDASSIKSKFPVATTLSLYYYGKDSGVGSSDLLVMSASPASNTALAAGDYDSLGTTSYGSLPSANWGGTYDDIAFNSNGMAGIRAMFSTTGIIKLGTKFAWDFNASYTGAWAANVWSYFNQYWADDTTANNGKDPKLVITHLSLKAVNGVAMESVKTLRSGVLIASGKTFNGLT
jgi:hypothetical protein